MNRYPDFIGIGGHKCASTWLSECLRDHPEIFMSNPKEIGYFSDHLDKGQLWYLKHFANARAHHSVVGEFTSYYIYDLNSIKQIKEQLGQTKIIAVLRDPVSRSLSQIKHGIREGIFSPNSIIGRIELSELIKVYPRIIDRSLYADGLQICSDLFGEMNILVLNQSDFEVHSRQCLKEVYKFLGVDDGFVSNRAKKLVSKGIVPRWMWLEYLRKNIYRRIREVPGIIPFLRRTRITELYRTLNSGNVQVKLSPDAVSLIHELCDKDWEISKKFCFEPSEF